MSRINIPDSELWAHGGDKDKPDLNRFEKGNESGATATPPKHSDHNYEMNRADQNIQHILRNGLLPWDSQESYPAGIDVLYGSKFYESLKASTDKNPATSPEYWKDITSGTSPQQGINLSDTDLNTLSSLSDCGFYYQTKDTNTVGNNYPYGQSGCLLVMRTTTPDSVIQIYWLYKTAKMYTRTFSGGTWSSWSTIYDSNNPPTSSDVNAVSKLGDTMTGSLSISTTENAASKLTEDTIHLESYEPIIRLTDISDIGDSIAIGYSSGDGVYVTYTETGSGEPVERLLLFHQGKYPEKLVTIGRNADDDEFKSSYLMPFENGGGSTGYPSEYGAGLFIPRSSGGKYYGFGFWSDITTRNPRLMLQNPSGSGFDFYDLYTSKNPPTVEVLKSKEGYFYDNPINLGASENLDNVVNRGIYAQTKTANATIENNYPTNEAGCLIVMFNASGRVTQEYTTYNTNRRFIRWAYMDSSSQSDWEEIFTEAHPPTLDEIGLGHIGKACVGTSVQANDVSDSYIEFYDYGSDDFDLVSFDPSQYETHIYHTGYYLVDVEVLRDDTSTVSGNGINAFVMQNSIQIMHGFVPKETTDKRNSIRMRRVLKLNSGDKIKVYTDKDGEWTDGGSIGFQYLRPLTTTTKQTKDK